MRRMSGSQRNRRRSLRLESLESRDLLAIYLPTSFASAATQPVGMAYNGGEQVFFASHDGELQFGFGNSAQASSYGGAGWNQLQMDDLPQIGSLPDAVGRPAVVVSPGGIQQVVFRNNSNNLTIVDSTDWEPRTIGPAGVDSHPVAVSMHGGSQVFHVNDTPQSHVVMSWSTDGFQTHNSTSLNTLFGVGSAGSAMSGDALNYGGVAAFESGNEEHVIYRRADGDLGVMTFGATLQHEVLKKSQHFDFVPPKAGPEGEISFTSYDSTGSGGTHNVGWIAYRDVNDELRLIWKVAGQYWQTASVTDTYVASVPTLAYDEASQKVSVAFVCDCGYVRLLQESPSGWAETSYHSGDVISIPLPSLGIFDAVPATQASGTVVLANTTTSFSLSAAAGTLADGSAGNNTDVTIARANDAAVATGNFALNATTSSAFVVSAVPNAVTDGVAGNGLTVVLQSGASTSIASYAGNVLTVNVSGGADTVSNIVAAIHADVRFNAVVVAGGGATTSAGDLTTCLGTTAGGSNGTTRASYSAFTDVITVNVAIGDSGSDMAAAIDDLPDFDVSSVTNGASTFNPADIGTQSNIISGGTDAVSPGSTPRPDMYWRSTSSSGVAAGLHILYLDEAGHVQNFRPAGQGETPARINGVSPIFDSTAYLEGYSGDFGYGLVNAARAVAYALNASTAVTGNSASAWNLDIIRAADAWVDATGQNTAVFLIDSGIDSTNTDLQSSDAINVSTIVGLDDVNGHGTAMAGIIAAADDSSGSLGVAYDSDVISIKVGDEFVEDEIALANAIDAAVNYSLPMGYADETRILNLGFAYSFDTDFTELVLPLLRTVMYVYKDDAVYVTAAGNRARSQAEFPAGNGVGFGIVAGAIDAASEAWVPASRPTDNISAINYLLAPGVNVEASTLVGSSGNNHNTANIDGTGAAAAHVSGVLALMLEANPNLTPREAEAILVASADPVTAHGSGSATTPPLTIYWA